jgi:hypothetical protein
MPLLRHEALGFLHRVLAVVEDAGRQHRIGLAQLDAVGQVLQAADAARGDHRNADRVGHAARQAQVEAGLGAVAVHAGQQDFAGAQLSIFLRPFDGVDAGRLAAAVREHFPLAGRDLLGVDRHHDALRTVLLRGVVHQLRVRHRRRIHADLVGAGVEQAAHILHLAHAAAHRQRNEHLRGDRFDDGRIRSRPSLVAVMSRKVSSSAPCSS